MEKIHLSHICKNYGGLQVLQDLNLELECGTCTVLMGPSGRGKTTLLRILMGLERADNGTISGLPLKKAAVFQEDRLCPDFSLLENIAMVLPARFPESQIREHLRMTGLEDAADQKVSELSGGMKRRTALVRAVLAESDMIFMDEPFKGLDPELKEQIISYVRKQTAGKTLLVVTHDREECSLLGGRLVKMDDICQKTEGKQPCQSDTDEEI